MAGGAIPELGGRTWADLELEVIEHAAGQLMFPAVVRRRLASGEVRETKVRVRIPQADDHTQARIAVVEWFRRLELDRKEDKDLFDHLEQLCILARAIRSYDAPHPQFAKEEDLATYDEGCIKDIQEQIELFKKQQDPRKEIVTEEDFWRMTIAVAKERDLRPLAATVGQEQLNCVQRWALEACRSPTGRHWLQSFGISIPEPSGSTSSEQS